MKPEEVTLDEMIEYCEHALASGTPFENRAWAIQQAITEQLKMIKRGLQSLSRDIAAARNSDEREQWIFIDEDEIGKIIQEKVKLTGQLTILEETLVNAMDQEILLNQPIIIKDMQKRIAFLNSRLFHLKHLQRANLQHRLASLDRDRESQLDHFSEADVRARIVEKIAILDNELKSL